LGQGLRHSKQIRPARDERFFDQDESLLCKNKLVSRRARENQLRRVIRVFSMPAAPMRNKP